jgi:hypothetical protein
MFLTVHSANYPLIASVFLIVLSSSPYFSYNCVVSVSGDSVILRDITSSWVSLGLVLSPLTYVLYFLLFIKFLLFYIPSASCSTIFFVTAELFHHHILFWVKFSFLLIIIVFFFFFFFFFFTILILLSLFHY